MAFKDIMKGAFGGPEFIDQTLSDEKPAPKKTNKRTVGSIDAAIEAQRIFNPDQPRVPNPKHAPAQFEDQGTSQNMDVEDTSWGGQK